MSVRELVQEIGQNGKIFTVKFIKRTTGEARILNCRLGVHKGVKGIGMSYDPKEHGLITVYDMQKQGFRMIATESVEWISGNGKTWYFQDGKIIGENNDM
jgi:hypothetical protein